MSTKSTITYGENFCLYNECFDDDAIYLELSNIEYTAERNSVTVRIPAEIWEKIRKERSIAYSNMHEYDLTDSEIEEIVKEEVNKRSNYTGIMQISGIIIYGSVELPIDQQIENGINWYKEQRQKAFDFRKKLEA